MGRADTPLRRILNYAQDHFCRHLPLVFLLTVIGPRDDGTLAVRGLFIGNDVECFEQAAELSVKVNFTMLDEAPRKMVVYLDPEEFHSTWLGNKAIYRTRMAIADGGELIVLAPGVSTFGEDTRDRPADPQVRLPQHAADHEVCRRDRRPAAEPFGRRPSDPRLVGRAVQDHLLPGQAHAGQRSRASATATATWPRCPRRYDPETLRDGWNVLPDGERIFYIGNPALGLWASRERLGA